MSARQWINTKKPSGTLSTQHIVKRLSRDEMISEELRGCVTIVMNYILRDTVARGYWGFRRPVWGCMWLGHRRTRDIHSCAHGHLRGSNYADPWYHQSTSFHRLNWLRLYTLLLECLFGSENDTVYQASGFSMGDRSQWATLTMCGGVSQDLYNTGAKPIMRWISSDSITRVWRCGCELAPESRTNSVGFFQDVHVIDPQGENNIFAGNNTGPWSHALQLAATHVVDSTSEDLSPLIEEFLRIFLEPTGLPPFWNFRYCIILEQGTNPVVVRPYRCPHARKDESERQCAKSLERALFPPSFPFLITYAVGKKIDDS